MCDLKRLILHNKLSIINLAFNFFFFIFWQINFDYEIHILIQLEQGHTNASCDFYRNTKEKEYVDLEITIDKHTYN